MKKLLKHPFMYMYTKGTVASHIDTVNTMENTYIKGHTGFDIHSIRKNIATLIVFFELLSTPSICIVLEIALQPLLHILSFF